METTEIKKMIYKEKPMAELLYIRKEKAYYKTQLENSTSVLFSVPVIDMGDADFLPNMEAKYLLRWIIE